MTLRAETNNAFLMKYLVIGIICIAFGCWASYDGLVAYPAKIPRSIAWEELLAEGNLDDAQRDAKYREIAQEKGWSVKHPSKDETVEKIQSNIVWQYIFMAIGFGIGIPLLIWYLRNKGTWIELQGKRLQSSWGQHFDFGEVTVFDKKKWDRKGLGVVTYRRDGQEKKFIIDDLKFDRRNTDEIVRQMEATLKPDQIINGAPEKLDSEPVAKES